MIKNIGWTLGNDCPCRCKHCYSFSVRQKGQNLTKEIVDKVIEQIEKLNVETVNLGGNEPIFTNGLDVKNSMLPYILKELNKRNIKVGITTAGISLIALKNTYPECLELLNDVDISLDSPFENEHNENRGGDVYKYAIQALEICKEYNIESGIIMCAMNWNFTKDRIDALLEIAKKYDSNIRFNLLKPIQPQHFKLVPSKEQVLENYKYLFEKCDTVELSEPILSGLTQNNKVKGCACGKDDIFDIINSEQFKAFKTRKDNYKNIEGCKDCDKADICRGGCFAMAYTYKKCETGEKDLYARDPFCFKDIDIENNINYKKSNKQLVHENYLCTWIGKPKK